MTLIGIGPFRLYRSIFFLFFLTPKVKQADETLRRVYNRNCKTLSMNRAGKHHSGFYPSSCPRNCSLLSSNKLDTYYLIHQSINLGEASSRNTKRSKLKKQNRVYALASGCSMLCAMFFSERDECK